jgi:hypothetical protein
MKARGFLFSLLALLMFSGVTRAAEIVHTERVRVGPHSVLFEFTDYPLRAERSLDIIFAPTTGITGLSGSWRLLRPDGSVDRRMRLLPRFPRDRSRWGLDSIALATEGRWTFELTIGGDTARLPLEVGPRPDGPPNMLIVGLSLIPIGSVLVLIVRAWMRVRPLRSREARAW